MVVLGVGGNKKVEKDGGDARALRDTRPSEALPRGSAVVATARHTPLEVGGEPTQGVVAEVGGVEGG